MYTIPKKGPIPNVTDHSQNQLNIINLPYHSPLTVVEQETLSLSLSFCPNEKIDRFELVKGLHLFT